MQAADDAALRARKAALRRLMRDRRAGLDPGYQADAGRAAAWHVLQILPWRERGRVALFWPLTGEIDTRPLLHTLHWLGATPLLPRMQGEGRSLTFHAWTPGTKLVAGPFRVMEPPPDQPRVLPEIVLTPLLAFDRRCHRLGYGAGFYDRTFAAIAATGSTPLRVGFGFACQAVDEVPVGDHDAPLDLVITESGPIAAVGGGHAGDAENKMESSKT